MAQRGGPPKLVSRDGGDADEDGDLIDRGLSLVPRMPKNMLSSMSESCFFHSCAAGVGGVALGVGMGVFVATFSAGHGELIGSSMSEQVRCVNVRRVRVGGDVFAVTPVKRLTGSAMSALTAATWLLGLLEKCLEAGLQLWKGMFMTAVLWRQCDSIRSLFLNMTAAQRVVLTLCVTKRRLEGSGLCTLASTARWLDTADAMTTITELSLVWSARWCETLQVCLCFFHLV